MRSRLHHQKEILHTYARLLDPDTDVVTPVKTHSKIRNKLREWYTLKEERADRRMLNGTCAVQMDTRSRLDRSLHVIEKTKHTGNETMGLLGRGTEALERARDNVIIKFNIPT